MKDGLQVDASELLEFYKSKTFGIQRGVLGVAMSVGQRLSQDLRKRLIRPRRINVQDRGASAARNPVTLEQGPDSVQVTLKPHYTAARTSALQSVLRRLSMSEELERDGLWVSRSRVKRSTSKGYASKEGLVYKQFSSSQKLEAWANRRDRGMQKFRHSVRIGTPEVWKGLLIDPAISRAIPRATEDAVRAVREA